MHRLPGFYRLKARLERPGLACGSHVEMDAKHNRHDNVGVGKMLSGAKCRRLEMEMEMEGYECLECVITEYSVQQLLLTRLPPC